MFKPLNTSDHTTAYRKTLLYGHHGWGKPLSLFTTKSTTEKDLSFLGRVDLVPSEVLV